MTEKAKKTPLKKDGNQQQAKTDLKFETFVVHSAKYQTLYTTKYKNRKKWEKSNDKHVLSYIPGTILKVLISEGDRVDKEQPILLLEAMKMENTVFAPITGKIKKINIKPGDRVPKGFLMIEFE